MPEEELEALKKQNEALLKVLMKVRLIFPATVVMMKNMKMPWKQTQKILDEIKELTKNSEWVSSEDGNNKNKTR